MRRQIGKILKLSLLVWILFLSGCLNYDLDIQFASQTHGQFVQQLHWRGGTPASDHDLKQWLTVLSDRAESVGGKTRSLGNEGFEIIVPFNNGQELEAKFNRFFAPTEASMPFTLPGGDPIQASLSLRQGNWLFAVYNHATLQLDLTSVPNLDDTRLPLLQNQQFLAGHVVLEAPWVRSRSGALEPAQRWSLEPGKLNEIEADFWVPSPIGIGAVAIALFVGLGYGVKYGLRER